MNQPRADNSPSNANWVTSLPPGWHLKRRGPQQELIQESHGKIGVTLPSAPTDGPVANEPATEASTLEELNPIASGSGSDAAAFHTILQQADLATGGSRPLSPGKVPDQTAGPALPHSRLPAASIPVATRIEPARREVSEIVVSESGRLTAANPDRSPDICQTSPDVQTLSNEAGFVSGIERIDPSGPSDVDSINNDFVSFMSDPGPGIQPGTIEPQSVISPAVLEMARPVKSSPPIAVGFPSPEMDHFSSFAPANAGVTTIPEKASNGSVPSQFQFVDPPKRAKKIVVKPKPEQDRTRFQAFTHRWFGPDTIGSYSLSTAFHLTIALVLSVVVVFHREAPNEGLGGDSTLIGQNGEGIGDGPLDATALNIEPAGGKGEELNTDLLAPQSISDSAANSPLGIGEHGAMAGGSGGKSGQGNGEGSGVGDGLNIGGYSMGGNAVRKGSFTVWTVPKDPLPREPYLIVIQVKYKRPEQKLVQADITGMVRGTDRYERRISPKTTRIIPEANQVVIEIPGALEKVEDSILVHSAILRESQRLQIVF